jgi:hypothetical protein
MGLLWLTWMLTVALAPGQIDAPTRVLSDQEIQRAIEMGRARNVPIVQVGTILGISKGDFNVFIEGPIARIAAAASSAFREYRPFEMTNVTPEMKEPVYRVIFKRDYDSSRYSRTPIGGVTHVVLQPRRAKGMDGAVQPIRENIEVDHDCKSLDVVNRSAGRCDSNTRRRPPSSNERANRLAV